MLTFFWQFFQNLKEKTDGKLLKTAFFWSRVLHDSNLAENGDLTWFKQEHWPKHQQILPFIIVKWSTVLSLGLKNPKTSRWKFFRQSSEKTLQKLRKFRKSCNHKQSINGIYNEKLHNNCSQHLPTLRLKTYDLNKLRNYDEKKMKSSNYSLVTSPLIVNFTVILSKIVKNQR